MTPYDSVLKNEEKAIFSLRGLYERYGYSQYKMSKFEEYDLYVKNKDFLISDSVITFTDRSGKLMALKPDVTLSILKNGKDESGRVQKVYYNENVYRPSGESFKEIMQVGLECIGDIDSYCIYETLMLAAKSLATISENYVLDISHLGVISSVFDAAKLDESFRADALKFIGEKNLHELSSLCSAAGISESDAAMLKGLVTLYGSPKEVLPRLRALTAKADQTALDEFEAVLGALENSEIYGALRIDFSVVHDIRYYNGIVFKGFIEGIPTGVLSGGQYDSLLRKMGRKSGAIGFAVYLDLLERLNAADKKYDADILLLYGEDADIASLAATVAKLSAQGTVMAQKEIPEKVKYKKLMKFEKSGVREI